ncbi:RraA family protein [Bauldia sp.]|uniref:RraA family protein n=1 Tax=Bauldia sp. TaxID=2575872 RepID=UPI003BABF0AB
MIDDPPLLTVRRAFPRPSAAQVAAFSGVPTGNVVDAMKGSGALDVRIKPIGGPASFCGVAVPCSDGPSDNLATCGALDVVQPGDVIVSASGEFTGAAVIGDLLLGMMKNSGCAAFVTDGCVRDIAGIRAVGLPCFAAGVTPNSPVRNGPGTIGLPVIAGGVQVGPGDIVVGDEDGVVIVPFDRIDTVISALAVVRAAEADLEAKVKDGLRIANFIQSRIDAGLFDEID